MITAVYGGSFDPIHPGHIAIARHLAQLPSIRRTILMVSPQNPVKAGSICTSFADRLAMARLACQGMEGVKVSDFESSLPSPSYTINTLEALSEAFPGESFRIVVGADNWDIIHKWREADRILREYGFIVYPRPGYSVLPLHPNVLVLENVPLHDVSSTGIRERIAAGENPHTMLDQRVSDYILSRGLYRPRMNP